MMPDTNILILCVFISVTRENISINDGKQKQCSFEDKTNCRITFKYAFDEDNEVIVWVKKNKGMLYLLLFDFSFIIVEKCTHVY